VWVGDAGVRILMQTVTGCDETSIEGGSRTDTPEVKQEDLRENRQETRGAGGGRARGKYGKPLAQADDGPS